MATRIKARKAKSKTRKQAKKAAKMAGKERRADGLVVGSDGAKLVDAVCSKGGATHAELKAIIKWRSCLPFMLKSAKQAGIRLRKEREGKEVRYFAA
jgi:pyrroline-5-carboxylate reductase